MHDPASFVDLENYPIDQTGSAAFNRLISGIHTDLDEKGCAHLPGFTNTFTVTLGIQPGQGGGIFQYSPNLRSPENQNYKGVSDVLNGDPASVHSLLLEPGDLQIFLGRYSLHSVSAVEGNISRYVGIFSYANAPEMCGRVERTKQLYGRVLPIHFERDETARADALED